MLSCGRSHQGEVIQLGRQGPPVLGTQHTCVLSLICSAVVLAIRVTSLIKLLRSLSPVSLRDPTLGIHPLLVSPR